MWRPLQLITPLNPSSKLAVPWYGFLPGLGLHLRHRQGEVAALLDIQYFPGKGNKVVGSTVHRWPGAKTGWAAQVRVLSPGGLAPTFPWSAADVAGVGTDAPLTD